MSKQKCEVYSRVVGYLSPISSWNKGKKRNGKTGKNLMTKKLLTHSNMCGGY